MSRKSRKKKEHADAEPASAGETPKEYTSEDIAGLEQMAAERNEFLDKLQRKTADYANRERRFNRELQETRDFALQDFVSNLFVVMDNFERALNAAREAHEFDALLEGVELTYRELIQKLASAGVKRMEPEGLQFDPFYHEAMAQYPRDDVPEGTIIEVFQPGYTMHERVVRHAKVIVSTTTTPSPAKAEEEPGREDVAEENNDDEDAPLE